MTRARPVPILSLLAVTLILGACMAAQAVAPDSSSGAPQASAPDPMAVGAAQATPVAPQVIELDAGEYFFRPDDLVVRPGRLIFRVKNVGPEREHTFAIRNLNGEGYLLETERFPVGATEEIEVTLSEQGIYDFICSVRGHADRGEVGILTVKSS